MNANNSSDKGLKKHYSHFSNMPWGQRTSIFVRKNGYGDMVIISMETYEKDFFLSNVYGKLEEAKQDMKNGKYPSVANLYTENTPESF